MRAWRHRDGGFVLQFFRDRWQLEICFARRRRDEYGVGRPFTVVLRTWPREEAA